MPKPTKSAIEEALALVANADKQIIVDALAVVTPLAEQNEKVISELDKIASSYVVPAGGASSAINGVNQHANQLRAFQNTFNYIVDDLKNRLLAFDPQPTPDDTNT